MFLFYVNTSMALNFFPEINLLLKMNCFKGLLNWNKIDEIVSDRLISVVIYKNLCKCHLNCLQFCLHTYQLANGAMVLKIVSRHYPVVKKLSFLRIFKLD